MKNWCRFSRVGARQRPVFGIRAVLLGTLGAVLAPVAMAQSVTVDWNSEFPTSDVSFPPDTSTGFVFNDAATASTLTINREFFVNGVSVGAGTFPPGSGITLPFTSDFVTYNDFAFGDAGVGNLPFVMDNAAEDITDRIVVTFDFDRPVINLAFNILDIDQGATSNDAVEVFFNSGAGPDQNVLSLPASARVQGTSVAISDIAGVDGFEGIAAADDTASGALQLDFGSQPVQSLRIEYFVGDNGAADPGAIFIGLGDITYEPTGPAGQADLSLDIQTLASPTVGTNTFYDIIVSNAGGEPATGVSVDVPVPSGFTFQSDDQPGEYNEITGLWTIPGSIPVGGTERLRIFANVNASGSHTIDAEVRTSDLSDPDSTPANAATAPTEDDTDSFTVTPAAAPPPLFCLGRPITPLIFTNPQPESPGANLTNPQVNDVFRFVGVSPGVDALVRVSALNNGASIAGIDNDVDGTGAPIGIPDNFQPTLVGPAGDVSAEFQFTFVSTGTSTPGTLDFAGSAIDVDGNGGGLREYIEVSNNIVEFALNGVTPPAPATRLVTQANVPPDPTASAPSSAARVRFEALTDDTATGIDPNEPRNIAAAFFTDVAVFEYRIGKFGGATLGRLNSLAFNCPNINPGASTGGTLTEEDFGDAPFNVDPAITPNYGNPIHVIDPAIQLGATNTPETAAGNSPTASTDTGDDGVVLPASFQGGTAVTLNVDARGAGGFLQIFVDWNADGDFEDAGEQPVVDLQDSDADDTTPIAVTITPPSETVDGSSFLRLRWSTASGLGIQDAAGDGEVEDYQVTLLAPPDVELQATKTTQVFDPNGDGLFAIPGNDVTYTITVSNSGGGATDDDSLFLIDELPPEITFFNGDADGPGPGTAPVNFTELVTTGLDPFVFANDVRFSDGAAAPANFAACNYTPVTGFDPAVTYICFNPKGTFLAGDPDPSFSVSFRARIR